MEDFLLKQKQMDYILQKLRSQQLSLVIIGLMIGINSVNKLVTLMTN
jgi:hypothetical protein